MEQRSEDMNQPRCWAARSARGSGSLGFCWVSGSMSRTAWELAPDSKKTSRMSISLLNSVWPQEQAVPAGGSCSGGGMYQASADSRMKRATMDLLILGERRGSPHLRQRKTAMGTPHIFWREMHQSGRGRTMLVLPSWPHAGRKNGAEGK